MLLRKKIIMNTYCEICGSEISKDRQSKHAKFCSAKCAKEKSMNDYLGNFSGLGKTSMPTATVGAMHELKVCIALMRLGYNVFRAQSPSCPCDLIAMGKEEILRIEVTTGYKGKNKISYPHKSDRYKYDILAVVFHNDDDILWFDRDGKEYTMQSIMP